MTHAATLALLTLAACAPPRPLPAQAAPPAPPTPTLASSAATVRPEPSAATTLAPPVLAAQTAQTAAPSADPGAPAGADVAPRDASAGSRHPPKLRSACVNVLADVKKRAQDREPLEEPARVDLDGDGIADWIFTTGADAIAASGHIYLARGGCGHWAGEWRGSLPVPLASSAHGVADLESGTPCKPICCPTETLSLYRFDGAVFRKVSERVQARDCNFGL